MTWWPARVLNLRLEPHAAVTTRGRITGRAACVSEPVLRQVGQAEGQSHAMCNRLPSRLGLAATSSLSSMGLAATGRGHCGAAGRAGGCPRPSRTTDGMRVRAKCTARLARVPCRRAPRPAGATACRAPRANGRSRDVKRERETYGGTLDATISICCCCCCSTQLASACSTT